MSEELPKQYSASDVEDRTYRRWLEAGSFHATPDQRDDRYVVMMPLPNVTGALHMGHALDNVMQDLLIRWHRMRGDNSLWMAGTDHGGIATQAVVEKRLLELEGKTRNELGRDALVRRIWDWKDRYQGRIVSQQQKMGCSSDWDRQRFTMDPVCSRAVRWTFFAMFRDGLIYRGNRMVNWDCHLQTAVSDDEIVHETVDGHFWHLRYPVIDPHPGEPDHVVVATTRPETMLGDTAVACHPAPRAALERAIADARAKLDDAGPRDRAQLVAELEGLEARLESMLPLLEKLAEMAADGRQVRLPLLDRPIPLIVDEWAKPELGSGCVKITPAHDPNDHAVYERHQGEIALINILEPDGRMNDAAGPYAGLDRFEVRARVVTDLDALSLLAEVEDRVVEIGHSDRSKTPIEPYLSEQWFVRMGDIDGGVVCGRGTAHEQIVPGLAQAAIDAASDGWSSPTGRSVRFHPDPERYRRTFTAWLLEKRDWCISRQLWWGHRIPIWTRLARADELPGLVDGLRPLLARDDTCVRLIAADGSEHVLGPDDEVGWTPPRDTVATLQVCLRDEPVDAELGPLLAELRLERDPDVLDTWFSSSLWPLSTLGWPDPETAALDPGQPSLGATDGQADCLSYYYPGSCLITGRDIITLWVARMVLMGMYNLGDVPFTDVFLHATILDGKGERMSKSKGNGIDPVDIIERYGTDAMRYVLCDMQTGTQDIRLPVHAISPFDGELIDLAKAKHGQSIFTYLDPGTGQEFDVLGTVEGLPTAKLVSARFEVGRNFCTKLWNAARFAFLNLDDVPFRGLSVRDLQTEDRWILSRLSAACARTSAALDDYNPSAAIGAAREFFWSELCDWYLELLKPRLRAHDAVARQVLAAALDQVLRLLHPFVPFITEELWQRLAERAESRGIERPLTSPELLIGAPWPAPPAEWADATVEAEIELMQEIVRAFRDLRSRHGVSPRVLLPGRLRATGAAAATLTALDHHIRSLAGLEALEIGPDVVSTPDAATAIVRGVEIYLPGVVDLDEERDRLTKQRLKVDKALTATRRKLGNDGFVAKAKLEVVERQRQRLADLEKQLQGIDAGLDNLG